MPKLEDGEYEALTPEQKSKPPEEIGRGEYWPTGPGADQLKNKKRDLAPHSSENTPARSKSIQDIDSSIPDRSPDILIEGIAKRADSDDNQIMEIGDEDYPFYYPIDDMVKWYGDVKW